MTDDDYSAQRYDDRNECAVLGAMMMSPDRVREEFTSIWPEAWGTERARELAALIVSMLDTGQHIDANTVQAEAMNRGPAAGRVRGGYVFECLEQAAIPESVPVLAERIRNLAICHKLHDIGTHLAQRAESSYMTGDKADVDEHVAYLKRAVEEIDSREVGGRKDDRPRRIGDWIDEWWPWLDAPPEKVRSIMTPWPELDDILAGGLHPGRSYLFAGRPGGGKSLALTNIAAYAAEHGHPGVLFSAEMGGIEVVSRILAAGARAEYGQIARRSVDDYNRGKVAAYAKVAHDIPLRISDKAPITITEIRSQARRLKNSREGLHFVAVDYVQLLNPVDSKLTRERQIAEISWGLKTMSKELDVAVVSACQLNRSAARDKRPPTIAELRESGALEQDSDTVILIHHKLANDRPTGEVDFIVGKNRAGKLTEITLDFRGYQARIGG